MGRAMNELEHAWTRFVDALARTRLPTAGNAQGLALKTVRDRRIANMLGDLGGRHGWQVHTAAGQLKRGGPEDMLWLWCMHSLWAAPECADLLAATCRPGWPRLTNGAGFVPWLAYGPQCDDARTRTGGRADIACFLGPHEKPWHAFFCGLALLTGSPGRRHKDCAKITGAQTALPVWHVLIEGSLSEAVGPHRSEFTPAGGHRVARLVLSSGPDVQLHPAAVGS
jgi:hypothetical protein